MRATIRRAIGANTNTAGKATAQAQTHALSQYPPNPSTKPVVRKSVTPETIADIKPDKIKPNRIG